MKAPSCCGKFARAFGVIQQHEVILFQCLSCGKLKKEVLEVD